MTELVKRNRLLGVAALAVATAGCDGSTSEPEGCDQCGGAADCFAVCACQTGDHETCSSECNLAPASSYLFQVDNWPAPWIEFASSIVRNVNESRSRGACCARAGCFEPAASLSLSEELEAAARRHALDLLETGLFSHTSADGRSAFDRIRGAGYRGCAMGENLAAQIASAPDVVEHWLNSPDHCVNVLAPTFTRVGVAYAEDGNSAASPIWVMTLGG